MAPPVGCPNLQPGAGWRGAALTRRAIVSEARDSVAAERWKLELERFRLDLVDWSKLTPEERITHLDAAGKIQHMLDMMKPRRR